MDPEKIRYGDMICSRFSQRGKVDETLFHHQFNVALNNYLKRKQDQEKEDAPILLDN